jgi:membrane-associated protease RseP (regulator of RpoE activity)
LYDSKVARIGLFTSNSNSDKVLFLGDPYELLQSVSVSPYVSRYGIFPASFPPIMLKLAEYVFNLSLALAFFNALPCIFLDGNLIGATLVDIAIPDNSDRNLLVRIALVTIGTFLIAVFLLVQLINSNFSVEV